MAGQGVQLETEGPFPFALCVSDIPRVTSVGVFAPAPRRCSLRCHSVAVLPELWGHVGDP